MKRRLKGQTSMILIVLIIIIFMAIGIFLLISSIKPVNEDYYNLYAHNLLLTVLRTHTGYGGECETYASTLACAYMKPYRGCGTSECRNLSYEITPYLIEKIIKPNLDYCLVIEPEEGMQGEKLVYGPRCDVVLNKRVKWTANEKILQYGANLNIKFFISEG